MPLTLVRTAAPAAEPVALADAKLHLKADGDDDNSLIAALVTAAREWCESWTQRAFVTQTWRLSLDAFPYFDAWRSPQVGLGMTTGSANGLGSSYAGYVNFAAIRLPKPPLLSVSSVTYVDTAGVTQVLAGTEYLVDADSEPARLTPAYGKIWPIARVQTNTVRVTYQAGYGGAAAVPASVGAAVKLLVGHWYLNREAVGERPGGPLALAVESLLAPFWVGEYR